MSSWRDWIALGVFVVLALAMLRATTGREPARDVWNWLRSLRRKD